MHDWLDFYRLDFYRLDFYQGTDTIYVIPKQRCWQKKKKKNTDTIKLEKSPIFWCTYSETCDEIPLWWETDLQRENTLVKHGSTFLYICTSDERPPVI